MSLHEVSKKLEEIKSRETLYQKTLETFEKKFLNANEELRKAIISKKRKPRTISKSF